MEHRIKNRRNRAIIKIIIMLLLVWPPVLFISVDSLSLLEIYESASSFCELSIILKFLSFINPLSVFAILMYSCVYIWNFLKPKYHIILNIIMLLVLLYTLMLTILPIVICPILIKYIAIIIQIIDICIVIYALFENIRLYNLEPKTITRGHKSKLKHVIIMSWWFIQTALIIVILFNNVLLLKIGILLVIIVYLLIIYIKRVPLKIKKVSSYIMLLILLFIDAITFLVVILNPINMWLGYLLMSIPYVDTIIVAYYIVQISKVKELQKTSENSTETK